VLRLPDGSFRYYYASRTAPPFMNLYFAINTARWAGPKSEVRVLKLPPERGDRGLLACDPATGRSIEVLEVIDDQNAIVRAWYVPSSSAEAAKVSNVTFIDVWLRGIDTKSLGDEPAVKLTTTLEVVGNQLIDTTCGKRSFVVLEAVK
jgi:hypothetical protein